MNLIHILQIALGEFLHSVCWFSHSRADNTTILGSGHAFCYLRFQTFPELSLYSNPGNCEDDGGSLDFSNGKNGKQGKKSFAKICKIYESGSSHHLTLQGIRVTQRGFHNFAHKQTKLNTKYGYHEHPQ